MPSCPVCRLPSVPPEEAQCPQCDADLTCFRALDRLPDEAAAAPQAPPARLSRQVLRGLAAASALSLIVFQLLEMKAMECRLMERQAASAGAVERLSTAMKRQIEKLREERGLRRAAVAGDLRDALNDPGAGAFWTYRFGRRDTAWSVARRFYGSGRLYPVLFEHNPALGVYTVEPGEPVRILTDAAKARAIYARLRLDGNGRRYWMYRIAQGDTPASIFSKFRATPGRAGRGVEPGARIEVPLEP